MKLFKQAVLSFSVLAVAVLAQADIRIDGAYQGVVQSQGFGNASCAVNLDRNANSYVLKLSICRGEGSCSKAKFQASSRKSALSSLRLDAALKSAQVLRDGSQIFTANGYNYGGDEAVMGRVNAQGELVQIMYTAGGWMYPVYIVCGNLARN